jgi:predicted RNase H-like HicB family nuclease
VNIQVLIEPIAGNGYRASTGEPLALCADGATKEEAVGKLRQMIDQRLQQGALLVSVDVPIVDANNPWLRAIGMYDPNDPIVQEWIEIMAENRRKMDADPNIP